MINIKVLVCSASPDKVNSNLVLRGYVGKGFEELCGRNNVVTSSLDSAFEMAKTFKPDLIVVFGSCMPAGCDYISLRGYCSKNNATLVFWLHDDPYEFDFNFKIYDYADYIFTNDKWASLHIDHPRVFHLPLAADPSAHYRPIGLLPVNRDVFFCGVAFPNRRKLLADCEEYFSKLEVEIFGSDWPQDKTIYKNNRLPNEVMPDFYASSLVTLNIGRRFNLANKKYLLDPSTPGPRTFEAAMAGAVQCIFLEGMEIEDYFIFDHEILAFDSPRELDHIINELSSDPQRRLSIARASQLKAIKYHSYKNRAQKMIDLIGVC